MTNTITLKTSLSETALLVKLNTKKLGLVKQNKALRAEIAERHNASERQVNATSNVFDPKHPLINKIVQIDGYARNLILRKTSPWADTGHRIITCEAYPKLKDEIDALGIDRADAVDELVQGLDELIADIESKSGSIFDRSKIPAADEIRDAFHWDFITSVIPEGGTILQLSDAVQSKLVEEVTAREASGYAKVAEDIFAKVHEKLHHLAVSLGEYGDKIEGAKKPRNFDNSIIPNLVEVAHTIKGLNLTGDPRLSKLSDDIVDRLTKVSPEELRGKVKGDKRAQPIQDAEASKKREEVKDAATELLDDLSSVFGA